MSIHGCHAQLQLIGFRHQIKHTGRSLYQFSRLATSVRDKSEHLCIRFKKKKYITISQSSMRYQN